MRNQRLVLVCLAYNRIISRSCPKLLDVVYSRNRRFNNGNNYSLWLQKQCLIVKYIIALERIYLNRASSESTIVQLINILYVSITGFVALMWSTRTFDEERVSVVLYLLKTEIGLAINRASLPTDALICRLYTRLNYNRHTFAAIKGPVFETAAHRSDRESVMIRAIPSADRHTKQWVENGINLYLDKHRQVVQVKTRSG